MSAPEGTGTTLAPAVSEAAAADRKAAAGEPKARAIGPAPVPEKGSGFDAVSLQRHKLVGGVTTGESVKFDQFPEDRPHAETGREVTIRPETVDKYNLFLTTYVTELNKMAEKPAPPGSTARNLREHVLADPSFESSKLLVQLLSKDVVDASGNPIKAEVDETAVKSFLAAGKEDNWAVTTALMEQHALLSELGLGIAATVDEQIYNKQPKAGLGGKKKSVILDETPTLPKMGRTLLSKTITGLAAAGYFIGGPGKTKLDFSSELALLSSVKAVATDEQKAFFREVIKIDVDAINITGPLVPGTGPISAAYREGYQPNIEDIEAGITNDYAARKEFLTQLGIDEPATRRFGREVDRSVDIRLPEEFIFDSSKHPEGLSVRYSMDIMEEYQNLVGTATDRFSRLNFMAQARETVMVRYLQRELALQKAEKEGGVQDLKDKKGALEQPKEELIKDKKEALEKQRDKATEKKADAEKKKTELTIGDTSLEARDRKVQSLETQLVSEFEIALEDNFEGAVDAKIGELKAEVERLEGELNTAYDDKSQVLDTARGEINKAVKDFTDAIKNLRLPAQQQQPRQGQGGQQRQQAQQRTPQIPQLQQGIIEQVASTAEKSANTKYDKLIERKAQQVTDVETKLKALQAKKLEYKNAVYERDYGTLEIVGREPGQLQAGKDALDMFTGGATPLVTADQLRELSVEELIAKQSGTTLTDEEKTQRAILAKAEVVAQGESIPKYYSDALTEVTDGTGLTPDDLFRSITALGTELRTAKPGTTPEEARTKLLAAREAAHSMLRSRYKARLDIEIHHYDEVAKEADKKIGKLTELFKPQVEEMDAAIKILEGKSELYARAHEAADDRKKMETLTDTGKVGVDDITYSEAERTRGSEKGYYEWLKLLHPEYVKAINRNEVFEALYRSLPPEKLADLLNTHMRLGIATVPLTLTDVLSAIKTKNPNGPEMQQATKQLSNYIRDRALALT